MNDQIEKEFEGCRLTPYQDSVGVWTDGYGNTHGVVPNGPPITQEKADADLLSNLRAAINAVERAVHTPMTDDEEGALVDLVFNIGAGNFEHSTLLRLLNAGDYAGAADQFGAWDKAGGQVLAGLARRRAAEAALFRQGMNAPAAVRPALTLVPPPPVPVPQFSTATPSLMGAIVSIFSAIFGKK